MLTPQEEYDLLVEEALNRDPDYMEQMMLDEDDLSGGSGSRVRRIIIIIITLLVIIAFIALELAPLLQTPIVSPPPSFPTPSAYPQL